MHFDPLKKRYETGSTGLALLVDPDKATPSYLDELLMTAAKHRPDYFFAGGSLLTTNKFEATIEKLKTARDIPVVIFPGSLNQISSRADAFLLLSLISGRNPELLIGEHVKAAPILKKSGLELWPAGYMLIDGGKPTTASYISNSNPIPADKPEIAATTALAAEQLGFKLIYLDAGSGADRPVSSEMIAAVKENTNLPVIVGGGINTPHKAEQSARAGADLLVVGNAVEQSPKLFEDINSAVEAVNADKSIS